VEVVVVVFGAGGGDAVVVVVPVVVASVVVVGVVEVVCVGCALTVGVAADVATVVPEEFDAITETRSVAPTSACVTTY
jgi:hypothetical protein